jgi:hypothetical protein
MMNGRRGSLRSYGESNCKRFLPYQHLQRSRPSVRGGGTLQSQATIALGGNFPSTFSLGTFDLPGIERVVLFNALSLAKNEHG